MKISKLMKYGNILIHILLFICVTICVFFGIAHRAIKSTYGNVSIDQILFHLKAPAESVDFSILVKTMPFVLAYIVFIIIYAYFIYYAFVKNNPAHIVNTINKICHSIKLAFCNMLKCIIKIIPPTRLSFFSNIFYIIICIILCGVILNFIDKKYSFIAYLDRSSSNFIEENYKIPTINFNKKKNLVLIFLESIEKGYADSSVFDGNLIPELERLAQNNISFAGCEQTYASGWTQSAHINMLLGIPLLYIIGNEELVQNSFFKNAYSITDELKKQGYSICSMFGASGKFADMKKIFSSHGVSDVREKDYYDNIITDPKDFYGTGWGYKDSFIYEKMYEEYVRLRKQKNPFCLIMRTVDTHFPDGYVDRYYKKYGDMRDSVIMASKMCSEFVDKIQSFDDDTAIIIIGDHLWMDPPSEVFTKFTKKLHRREIYNVFINTVFSSNEINTLRKFAPFDMAPTILESIGAKLEGSRFGLGTSLFSKEKTLIEKYGINHINNEFKKEQRFYFSFL